MKYEENHYKKITLSYNEYSATCIICLETSGNLETMQILENLGNSVEALGNFDSVKILEKLEQAHGDRG